MIKEEIAKIENELNIKLTDSYKNLIETNPFADKHKYPNVYNSLFDDSSELIRINLELRKNGFKNKAWSSNLFVIGTGCKKNYYYFINLDENEKSKIYSITEEDKFNPQNIKKLALCSRFDQFVLIQSTLQNIDNKYMKNK